jgi:hypothetical protein
MLVMRSGAVEWRVRARPRTRGDPRSAGAGLTRAMRLPTGNLLVHRPRTSTLSTRVSVLGVAPTRRSRTWGLVLATSAESRPETVLRRGYEQVLLRLQGAVLGGCRKATGFFDVPSRAHSDASHHSLRGLSESRGARCERSLFSKARTPRVQLVGREGLGNFSIFDISMFGWNSSSGC